MNRDLKTHVEIQLWLLDLIREKKITLSPNLSIFDILSDEVKELADKLKEINK